MITGDARQVADAVAADLGIDEVFAEVLPEDKERHVRELQERGHRVAMVGDGVNDAPALARADVGIAIGAGTDVAIESAGVILASDDPRGVVGVIALSRASYRKMVQNLVWAAGYNIVAIPLAAGVLAPWADHAAARRRRAADEPLDDRRRAQRAAAARARPQAGRGERLVTEDGRAQLPVTSAQSTGRPPSQRYDPRQSDAEHLERRPESSPIPDPARP